MNDQKIPAILIEVLENVCNKFPETRDYIDKNIQEICSRENLVYHQIRNFDSYNNTDILSINGNEPPTKKTKINSRKSEEEIKLDLIESILKAEEESDYAELVEKAQNVREDEDAIKIIGEYEKLIKTVKGNFIPLACQQGYVFKKLKKSKSISKLSQEIGIGQSTIFFKINLYKLVDKYPKLMHSTLSLNYFKNHFKLIKSVCKKSCNEFKFAEP